MQIGLVGRYAVNIQWSDGHDSGIYSYPTLRGACPCPVCRPETPREEPLPVATIDDIRERLTEIRPHGARDNMVALGMVKGIDLRQGTVTIQMSPGSMPPPILNATLADIRRAVGALPGVQAVAVQLAEPQRSPAAAPAAEQRAIPGVRDIVAVSSTKGGVGKSTVAANLALALQAQAGSASGCMDADVYGPSLPIMLGVSGRPQASSDKRMCPLEKFGLQLMSMGFFLDDSSPVIWRGPLVMGLVRQFLKDVDWGDARHSGDRHAPRHRRRAADPGAAGAAVRRRGGDHAAGRRTARRAARHRHVPAGEYSGARDRREHELLRVPEVRPRRGASSAAAAARASRSASASPCSARSPWCPPCAPAATPARRSSAEQPDHPVSRIFAEIAGGVLAGIDAVREPAPVIIS